MRADAVSALFGLSAGGAVGLGLALLTDASDPAAFAAVSALLAATFGCFAPVAWGGRFLPVLTLVGAAAGAWVAARLSWDVLADVLERGPGWHASTAILAGLGAAVIWVREGASATRHRRAALLYAIALAVLMAAVFLPLSFAVDLGLLINLSRITISGELPDFDSPELRAGESVAYFGLFLLFVWLRKAN